MTPAEWVAAGCDLPDPPARPTRAMAWAGLLRELEPLLCLGAFDRPRDLARALRQDPTGALHRRILDWLTLPPGCRPRPLRRLGLRRPPSRLATARLLQLLDVVAQAHLLFGELAALRQWMTFPIGAPGGLTPTYPLVDTDRPAYRSASVARVRRTQYGIW